MRALVVFYSRTGQTRKAGKAIAEELGCDAEGLVDSVDRSGPKGFMMSGRQTMMKELTRLEPVQKDPGLYDVVILGTPVWVLTMSIPVRTYILENREKFKRVAFFATAGNMGLDSTFKDMEELCGKKAEGTLGLTARDISGGKYKDSIKKFAGELKLE